MNHRAIMDGYALDLRIIGFGVLHHEITSGDAGYADDSNFKVSSDVSVDVAFDDDVVFQSI